MSPQSHYCIHILRVYDNLDLDKEPTAKSNIKLEKKHTETCKV